MKNKLNKIKWTLIALGIIHFALAVYFNTHILGSVPHIPDSAVYYEQAILLDHGKLFINNFDFEPAEAVKPLGGVMRDGKLYFQYNHFWPFLLALFLKFNLQWLLNPLLSALSLLLVYLISEQLYHDKKVSLISAILYCVSPITIVMAGDYMMHTATQFCLLAAFYFLLSYIAQDKGMHLALSGLFLGYAFGLRQLTVVGMAVPVLVYLLVFYRKNVISWKGSFFLYGFVPVFLLFIIDNKIITGSYLSTTHAAFHGLTVSFGNLLFGVNNAESLLGFVPPIIFYSVLPMLFIALAFIPLISLRQKEDYLLIGVFVSLFVAHFFISSYGIHGYGPRFVFEGLFAFFILAARGIAWLSDTSTSVVKKAIWVAFAGLLIFNLYGLYTILPDYINYNSIDSSLVKEIGTLDLTYTILLLPPTAHWQEQGLVAIYFDPTFEHVLPVKENSDKSHFTILEKNPDRAIYRLENGHFVPYTLDQLRGMIKK